jgi:hypothetical protein
MAAIFDFPLHLAWDSIHTDTQNMDIAVRFSLLSLYKLGYTLLHIHFRLMAAIFDFILPLASHSICACPIVLLDPENVGIAVEISLLSGLEAEIHDFPYPLPVNGRHL